MPLDDLLESVNDIVVARHKNEIIQSTDFTSLETNGVPSGIVQQASTGKKLSGVIQCKKCGRLSNWTLTQEMIDRSILTLTGIFVPYICQYCKAKTQIHLLGNLW